MNLDLTRPLVGFDLETTGVDTKTTRIVELALVRLMPDGPRVEQGWLVNPGCPIPAEASAIHGITDEHVNAMEPFRSIAPVVLSLLQDADLLGFNLWRFDLPVLRRELLDCGHELSMDGRRVIDAMRIFHHHEPRDLGAAVRFYCGREHNSAHRASADVEATVNVFEQQLQRYDLERDLDRLHDLCADERGCPIDVHGVFLRTKDGRTVFAIGKHAGVEVGEVARKDRSYLDWFSRADFARDAKAIVAKALRGVL